MLPFLPAEPQQWVLSSLSLFFNVTFLGILILRDRRIHIFYRSCLAVFTTLNIIYTIMYMLTLPIIALDRQGALLIGRGVIMHNRPLATFFSCSMYLIVVHSSFLLALHFLFIYTQLNHEWNRLHSFLRRPLSLLVVLLLDILFMSFPSLVTFLRLSPNQLVEQNKRDEILRKYGIDLSQTGYIASLFRSKNPDGTLSPQWDHIGLKIGIYIMLLVTMSFNLTLCYKIMLKMRSLAKHSAAAQLQVQMFQSLVAQTIVPFLFCYTPSMLTYTLPLLNIEASGIAPYVSFLLMLFPICEPLVLVYFLVHLRRDVQRALCCLVGRRYTEPTIRASEFVTQTRLSNNESGAMRF